MKKPLLFILAQAIVVSIFAQQNSSSVIYLIGDAGEPFIESSPIGNVLRRMLEKEESPATVVYLGDNVYPRGVPARDSKKRSAAEEILAIQAGWIKGLNANGIFIPGNHDWNKGGKDGWDRIIYQQLVIDSLHDHHIRFFPEGGCPGPVEIPLSKNALLVIIDSQWLLHPWKKPGEESECDAKTGAELASLLEDIYASNSDKRIILAAHHPLITYGEHGGVFTFKDHIFPLTNLQPNLYIPIPIIGSIYPLYRKWFGDVQDLAHPSYRYYSASLQKLMRAYPGSIHVAGHEHALEYITKDSSYFIVSGAGAKSTSVKQKGYAEYAASVNGFVRIYFSEQGEAQVTFIQVDKDYVDGHVVFADTLAPVNRPAIEAVSTVPDFGDSLVTARASEQYLASPWRKKMLGENYREEWYQQLKVPVFDIGAEHGGLTIVKKGGGMQTLSLRLADSTGKEYTLRSVEKYPEGAVPEMLRKTFAQDLVQDQISAAHPYGALVIPPMADAVGVYHANPKLVYIPDDPRLGIYRKSFSNMLALYEEHADGDWSDKAFFGNSEDIINTSKVISKLQKDNDNQVDQHFVVRSRLFDMVIGDWDRHNDQWRWATIEKKKKKEIYRPIPRDRDQALFVNEGLVPKIWSRKWALPKFEGFDESINWPSGLSFNARYFDRSFLTGLSKDDWISAAKEIQTKLTDEVIDSALRSWPDKIYALHGEEVSGKLKSRRDHLVEYAISHYEFLAREVDIVGSDKKESFDVERLSNGDVHVKVFSLKKGEEDDLVYDRLFHRKETHEIRLYGLDDDDEFNITGHSQRTILVRVVGGDGKDQLIDESKVNALGKRTFFYDIKSKSEFTSSGEVRDMTRQNPAVNEYDRRAFQYDRLAPLVYGNFNVDDGLFLGGGVLYQTHGFRKDPFKQRHVAIGSIAPRTRSFNFIYRGDFTHLIGQWNLELNADIKIPNFVNNFFGWGNESVFNQDIDETPGINADDAIDYYRFRFEEIKLEAYITRKFGSVEFKIGPALQSIEIEESDGEDRYVYDYAETLPYDLVTEVNSFSGVKWQLQFQKFDNPIVIRRGIQWNIRGSSMVSEDNGIQNFNSFESDIRFYHTFQYPGRLIFALRAGGGINTGKYEFYQAQILDGKTELRGFRKTRFYGDSKFYTNMEVRLKLASFRTYLFPVSFGLLGFHDLGRVWYKDENGVDPTAPSGKSNVWHKSWGGGIWFTPFNLAVLSTELGHSDEGNLFYIRLGFLF